MDREPSYARREDPPGLAGAGAYADGLAMPATGERVWRTVEEAG